MQNNSEAPAHQLSLYRFSGPVSDCSVLFVKGAAQITRFRMDSDAQARWLALPDPANPTAKAIAREVILTHPGDIVELVYATCRGRINRIREFRNLSLQQRRQASLQ